MKFLSCPHGCEALGFVSLWWYVPIPWGPEGGIPYRLRYSSAIKSLKVEKQVEEYEKKIYIYYARLAWLINSRVFILAYKYWLKFQKNTKVSLVIEWKCMCFSATFCTWMCGYFISSGTQRTCFHCESSHSPIASDFLPALQPFDFPCCAFVFSTSGMYQVIGVTSAPSGDIWPEGRDSVFFIFASFIMPISAPCHMAHFLNKHLLKLILLTQLCL